MLIQITPWPTDDQDDWGYEIPPIKEPKCCWQAISHVRKSGDLHQYKDPGFQSPPGLSIFLIGNPYKPLFENCWVGGSILCVLSMRDFPWSWREDPLLWTCGWSIGDSGDDFWEGNGDCHSCMMISIPKCPIQGEVVPMALEPLGKPVVKPGWNHEIS